MATEAEEIDPLAAEQARLAVTSFRRTVVHAAHADEERALIAWSKKNRQARAKIRKRRDVQFETFKFAQKRLSDNRDALQQLDRRVRETNRLSLAKRRQIEDEAASMAAQQAQEMLIIDAATRASEEERRLLQDFAEKREGTQAELVATHALCEDLERQRRQEQEEHSRKVARDKRQLEKTAEEALLAARRAELAKTKARLSRNTRQQVVEMERMDGEMVLHREEMVRLRGEIDVLEADAAQLKTRLKDARRRQGAAARRMTTKRKMRRQRRPVLQVASPENRYKAADDASVRCRLSAARADRDSKLAESEKLQELQEEVRNASTFEVTALLSAARRRLPPCTPGSSTATLNQVRRAWADLDRQQRDGFVSDVFEELFERQQSVVVEDSGSPGKDILEEEATFASRDASHVSEPTLASGSYASGRTGDKTYETGATGAVARAPDHERDAISLLSVDEISGLADDDTLIAEARKRASKGGLTPVKPWSKKSSR
mmetsp:Transcript_21463/g.56079  ORF Transcript_21463/g.56079 Transcript_21463/m.56079 type:complete len:492 (-) Transcript_21463:10-1485(-)